MEGPKGLQRTEASHSQSLGERGVASYSKDRLSTLTMSAAAPCPQCVLYFSPSFEGGVL